MATPLEFLDAMQGHLDKISSDPKWLNNDMKTLRALIVDSLAPGVSDTPVASEMAATLKWCPFTRIESASGATINREVGKSGRVVLRRGAQCISHQCQMWTGDDCGIKHKAGGMSAMFDSYLESATTTENEAT